MEKYISINVPKSETITIQSNSMLWVSAYLSSYGLGLSSQSIVATVSYTEPTGATHTLTIATALGDDSQTMDQQRSMMPILVKGGTTVTVATAYAGGGSPFDYMYAIVISDTY